MHVIRRAAFTPMGWKNGAGTTLEIAVHGRRGEDFDWRLSMAQVARDCSFSAFAGCERYTTLVEGAGFDLLGPDGTLIAFTRVGQVHAYAGAVAWACRLRGGASWDLNLIVRKGVAARMDSVPFGARELQIAASAVDRWLVPLDASCELEPVAAPGTVRLDARDAALLAAGEAAIARVATGSGGGWLAIASLPPLPQAHQNL
jgi:environmental stress-induced protein Ves